MAVKLTFIVEGVTEELEFDLMESICEHISEEWGGTAVASFAEPHATIDVGEE